MYSVPTDEFEALVHKAIEALPVIHREKINNMAFFVRQQPSKKQAEKAGLKTGQTLFGLYEGVPLVARNGSSVMMPDTITIFQEPIESHSNNQSELEQHIKHTIWHEVAHYFGLNHKQIKDIENTFQ